MKLIDKSAVITEIERIMDSENENINSFEQHRNTSEKQRYSARMALLEHILSFLDTLEVKEVDTWQDVRERAAIAAMQGTITILSSSDRTAFRDIVVEGFRGDKKTYPNEIAQFSIACADSLIDELEQNADDKVEHKSENRWKPSEAQMEALKDACDEHWEPDGLHPLYTLYQQLKKQK